MNYCLRNYGKFYKNNSDTSGITKYFLNKMFDESLNIIINANGLNGINVLESKAEFFFF